MSAWVPLELRIAMVVWEVIRRVILIAFGVGVLAIIGGGIFGLYRVVSWLLN